MQKNIDGIIRKVNSVLKTHEMGTGKYARWIWQNEANNRDLSPSEYGCADAANILYTFGDFIKEPEERAKWIESLRSFQDPETGLFSEPTHHTIHTTAHCVAALELFDADARYPLKGLMPYATKEGLYRLLEEQDWDDPWSESHKGAGVFAALVIAGAVDKTWQDDYFAWFQKECDPDSGLWRKGYIPGKTAPLHAYMAGSFHYLFNHEYARQPLPYPEKMIDSMLKLFYEDAEFAKMACKTIGFIDVDWIYCMTRAMRQTSYKHDEAKKAVEEYAEKLISYLETVDETKDEGFNDLHALFGTVCALAELAQALPGQIISEKPLKLVLDRRPFI